MNEAVDAIEFAAYRLGGAVLLGKLPMNNAIAWAAHGYIVGQRDQNGSWSVLQKPDWTIRIRLMDSNQGCSVEFNGVSSVEIYEEVLVRARRRGFEFVYGERKPAEDMFIMDTLASESGLIGILSMMRVLVESPSGFSMTVFLSQSTQH
jgi:hypothetical protein